MHALQDKGARNEERSLEEARVVGARGGGGHGRVNMCVCGCVRACAWVDMCECMSVCTRVCVCDPAERCLRHPHTHTCSSPARSCPTAPPPPLPSPPRTTQAQPHDAFFANSHSEAELVLLKQRLVRVEAARARECQQHATESRAGAVQMQVRALGGGREG